jgi:hypothetical protein
MPLIGIALCLLASGMRNPLIGAIGGLLVARGIAIGNESALYYLSAALFGLLFGVMR